MVVHVVHRSVKTVHLSANISTLRARVTYTYVYSLRLDPPLAPSVSHVVCARMRASREKKKKKNASSTGRHSVFDRHEASTDSRSDRPDHRFITRGIHIRAVIQAIHAGKLGGKESVFVRFIVAFDTCTTRNRSAALDAKISGRGFGRRKSRYFLEGRGGEGNTSLTPVEKGKHPRWMKDEAHSRNFCADHVARARKKRKKGAAPLAVDVFVGRGMRHGRSHILRHPFTNAYCLISEDHGSLERNTPAEV